MPEWSCGEANPGALDIAGNKLPASGPRVTLNAQAFEEVIRDNNKLKCRPPGVGKF